LSSAAAIDNEHNITTISTTINLIICFTS